MTSHEESNKDSNDPEPQTQTEPERGGSGRPPRKTAIGYGGEDSSGYKPGEYVSCKITAVEPGGYAVKILTPPKSSSGRTSILKTHPPGFLPTQKRLNPGQEVLARFVCIHNNRILLSAEFTATPESQKASDSQQIGDAKPSASIVVDSGKPGIELSKHQNKFRSKRATDLFPLPFDALNTKNLTMEEYDLDWLVTDLESGMFTGVMKASSKEKGSHSGMLLYRGRAVGCIYVSKDRPDTAATEESIRLMLADLKLPETQVTLYELPDNVVLPMSALFVGYPVSRSDDYHSRAYFDYICNWFREKKLSACLAISLPSNASTCLAFVFKGQLSGIFFVEDLTFTVDEEFIFGLFNSYSNATVEASILPPEMTSSAVRLGFSLRLQM